MSVDVNPLFIKVQLSPLSVDRKTPSPHPPEPANKSLLELTAKDQMFVQVSPLLIGVQLSPLSVERKIPPPKYVPAKISSSEFIAIARTSVVIIP